MISNNDILDALNLLLKKHFTHHRFYINKVDDNFIRPSFFLEYDTGVFNIINKATLEVNCNINIIAFATLDKYSHPLKNEQSNINNTIMQILSAGYLNVKDRALTFTTTSKNSGEDLMIMLNFEYYDDICSEEKEYKNLNNIEIKGENNGITRD